MYAPELTKRVIDAKHRRGDVAAVSRFRADETRLPAPAVCRWRRSNRWRRLLPI